MRKLSDKKKETFSPLIVALDVPGKKEAVKLVKLLSELVDVFKVGPRLLLSAGTELIDEIDSCGKKVFLDLKLHDIPSAVAGAVASAGKINVWSLTLHTSGGESMLKTATTVSGRPKLWGVTVLTSVSGNGLTEQVVTKAMLAKACGLDGVVSSVHECAKIKEFCGVGFTVICPGIRLQAVCGDQKRIAAPCQARKAGADYIVVGREIIESKNPLKAAENILSDYNS